MKITEYYNNSTIQDTYKDRNRINMEDFLKIMAAEISNVNPMSGDGGSKTDYISQIAQLSSLEQMNDISDSLSILTIMTQQQYCFSLIGKEVKIISDDETVTGVVEKVSLQYGQALLQINGKSYYLNDVVEVSNSEAESNKGGIE